MTTALVCDDDDDLRPLLKVFLTGEGYIVHDVRSGEQCVDAALKGTPDVILLDLMMPGLDGIATLRELAARGVDSPVIVMTAFGAIESAIEATKLGAAAYLQKPLNLAELAVQVERVVGMQRTRDEAALLREQQRSRYGKILGSSRATRAIVEQLVKLENVPTPTVLIQGESGTGKELVAQAIHTQGMRKSSLFTTVDCASLPETLVESTLFGHERGAFTDAQQMRKGLFEVAGSGTIFLDEIGELPLGAQAKLLRALESRTFKRVGGVVDLPMTAAVVAATNRDLRAEIEAKRFRGDLFFRLNIIPLFLPPLRERPEDVAPLIEHFLTRFNRELGRKVRGVEPAAMEQLMAYRWPGNVRELKNLVERLMILDVVDVVRMHHLPPEIVGEPPPSVKAERTNEAAPAVTTSPSTSAAASALPSSGSWRLPAEGVNLDALERDLLLQAIERAPTNRTKAAALLGITRHALRYRLQKLGIDLDDAAGP